METKNITRREFLQTAGAGALAMGALAACGPKDNNSSVSDIDAGPEAMPMRTNPNTGDSVSLIGYGCMRWQMTKDENGKDIIDQNSVNELVDYAYSHGVNYFDSAPVYLQGQSERATAKALLRYPRNSYFVATKLSNFNDSSFEAGVKMYRTSLENYETDYIDYYLCHSIPDYNGFKTRFEDNGLIDFLLKEREDGHIRNLGFSFHGNKKGFEEMIALHDKYHWDFVQIQMNYVDWHYPAGECDAEFMYNELCSRNIPVVIMEPLLGGQLSNVPDAIANELKTHEPSKSIASWAFRFVGSHPGVLVALSGMTYMEHLKDNLDTFLHFDALSEDEMALLDRMASLIRNYPLVSCTGCQYCMPCPYGIDIPGIFRHYNNAVNTGTIAANTEQADYKKLKKQYLTSYDKAIESVRQADHCIGCGQCESRCPQHIRIPQQLQKIDRYVEKLKQDKF